MEWAAEEEGVEESEGEGGPGGEQAMRGGFRGGNFRGGAMGGRGMVPSHARVEEDKKMMENEYDFQEANDNVSTIMHFIF